METRYTPPTKFDTAKFGTTYTVLRDDSNKEVWIQVSPDDKIPEWQKIEVLFLHVFKEYIQNEEFIAELLSLYLDKNMDKEAIKSLL